MKNKPKEPTPSLNENVDPPGNINPLNCGLNSSIFRPNSSLSSRLSVSNSFSPSSIFPPGKLQISHSVPSLKRVLCIAVLNDKRQVLIGKRSSTAEYGADEFCFPAGRISFGESPTQAAQKELKEKTGMVLTVKPFCTIYSTKYLVEGFHSFAIGFVAKITDKEQSNLNPEWKFYDLHHLPTPLFDVNKQVVKMILQNKHFNF